MINSLSVLKKISDSQGMDSATADAIRAVSELLDDGLQLVEKELFEGTGQAPKPVSDISKYILDAGGKRIRPSLNMLCAKAFASEANPVALSAVCELLHNATLLHDDVIDEGDVRRGKPASRMVWSNALSILGGDYMLMRCVEMISQMNPAYMGYFVETLKSLVEGEIVQLRLRESIGTTKDEYFTIVNGKTSSLFRFATITGALSGGASEENVRQMGTFGQHIGVAFQLIDDVLDFSTDADELGKNLLADISQGKMTLPVILAGQKNETVPTLLAQLLKGEDTEACATKIGSLVRASGALDEAHNAAADHTEKSIKALQRVEAVNPAVITVLEQLSTSLLNRGN